MTDAPPDGQGTKPTPPASPADYGDKVLSAIQWALAALGAVAATAFGKVAFDQLSNGDFGDFRWLVALVSGVAFGMGVVALVGAVVAITTVSSVSFSWLRSATQPSAYSQHFWRWVNRTFLGRDPYLAWEVVSSIADSKYLIPGATAAAGATPPQLLTSFSDELTKLVAAQYQNPSVFAADANHVDRLKILVGARDTLREVAKRARVQQVSRQIPARFVIATTLAVLGAIGFGLVSTQAKRVAATADRKAKEVVVGDLLPKVPTSVRVLFPAGGTDRVDQQRRLSVDGTSSCDLNSVDGVLIGVATPPAASKPSPTDVMHVFTFASKTCMPVELWLPPDRVILPPTHESPAPAAGTGSSSPSTAPPSP